MAKSLYKTLGVKKSASDDEIRQAYRNLARKYHPDVNPGDASAENKFKEAVSAYEVLSDKKKRRAYDEFGDDALKAGFDAEQARAQRAWANSRRRGGDPFGGRGQRGPDLADLFGGRWSGGPSVPAKGADAQANVQMTLRQAIVGGDVELSVPGHGKLKVRIPPGADSGSVIRIKGKGYAGHQGGSFGDLVITTKVKAHPLVTRKGLDLTFKLPVTLDEAYNGAEITFPTFYAPVKLKIPPRSQSGARLRLKGKGVERGSKTGNLYVELDVRIPTDDDDELADAIRDNAEKSGTNPRIDLVL